MFKKDLFYSLIFLDFLVILKGLHIYIFSLFLSYLILNVFSKFKKILFGIISFSSIIFIFIISMQNIDIQQKNQIADFGLEIYTKIFTGTGAFFLVLSIISWKKIINYERKLFIKVFFITGIIYILVEKGVHLVPGLHFKVDESIVQFYELEVFYFAWNIVSLFFAAWYFNRARVNTSEEQINLLSEKYKITEREKDIILMVSKGFSNKELCDKLFISMATVKTHIRNIYEKTGSRNRVELLNLFKK